MKNLLVICSGTRNLLKTLIFLAFLILLTLLASLFLICFAAFLPLLVVLLAFSRLVSCCVNPVPDDSDTEKLCEG